VQKYFTRILNNLLVMNVQF